MNNNEGDIPTPDSAALYVVQGWMPHIGPVTSKELSERLGVTHSLIHQGLLQLEGQGQVLRGHFRPAFSHNPSPFQGMGKEGEESDQKFFPSSHPRPQGGERVG